MRIFRGEDVRKSGSGNIGATNVSRKSPALGVITLVLDALKGSAAVLLASYISRAPSYEVNRETQGYFLVALAALFAVVGHMFPVWLKFRGGKGVATGLGSFAVIAPKAVLVAAVVFVGVVAVFRFVSLGSILAVASFPVFVRIFGEYGRSRPALALMALASALIIAKHHANIRRLLAGTENRFGSKPKVHNSAPPARTGNS